MEQALPNLQGDIHFAWKWSKWRCFKAKRNRRLGRLSIAVLLWQPIQYFGAVTLFHPMNGVPDSRSREVPKV